IQREKSRLSCSIEPRADNILRSLDSTGFSPLNRLEPKQRQNSSPSLKVVTLWRTSKKLQKAPPSEISVQHTWSVTLSPIRKAGLRINGASINTCWPHLVHGDSMPSSGQT